MSLMNLRSLTWKFSLFYFALAFFALFMARSIALVVEFERFRADVDRGWLMRTTQDAARTLSADFTQGLPSDTLLRDYLDRYLTALTVPRDGSPGAGILSELPRPLSAVVTTSDSARRIVVDGTTGDMRSQTQTPQSDEIVHRQDAMLYDTQDRPIGNLALELRLPAHLWQVLFADSLEWLVLAHYMVIFILGSGLFLATYLNRRLRHIEAVAAQWETGDLSATITGSSADELGRLAHRLNHMTRYLRKSMDDLTGQATLKERQRLARGLHDTIKQRVLALNFQLATALRQSENATQELTTSLSEARQLTREIQDQLAHVVAADVTISNPAAFAVELPRRAEAWARRGGFRLRTKLVDIPDLSGDAYEYILAIVDEALANVMRHSRATTVDVYLGMRSGGDFVLIVADDGVGSSGRREGMGIRNMRERAGHLPDGKFVLSGETGFGMEVIVTWTAAKVPAESGT